MSGNPFSPDYESRLARELLTPQGRASASASRRASAAIEALRQSSDPHKALAGRGTIVGLGMPNDPAKAGRIMKAAKL